MRANNATCVKKFISGLGEGWESWEQTFNQLHSFFGAHAVSLEEAQESAIIESIRKRKDRRGPNKFALLTAQVVALKAQVQKQSHSQEKNTNGKPGDHAGRDRGSPCANCVKDPTTLAKYHPEERCWLFHPELYITWAEKNPDKNKARTARILAAGLTDPMVAKVATLRQQPLVQAHVAHIGMPIRGGALRGARGAAVAFETPGDEFD